MSRLLRSIIVAWHLSLAIGVAMVPAASAQPSPLDGVLAAVVQVRTQAEPDVRTADALGRKREGSGVVIDDDGLVLTIGYLMVEAPSAEIVTPDGRTVPAAVVGYDHETGFGLLRALLPLKTTPVRLGSSAGLKGGDAVLVASAGGRARAMIAKVASRREFAGSWEYLIENAIYTTPPHPAWSGAALLDREGRLVGIGSLIMAKVGEPEDGPGNMFVPVDLLTPILGDLIANGRASRPQRPWLGLSINEVGGELRVSRVTPDSPSGRAGVQAGARVLAVDGHRPSNLADYYRHIWAKGSAGPVIRLELDEAGDVRDGEIASGNRLDYLKLKSSL